MKKLKKTNPTPKEKRLLIKIEKLKKSLAWYENFASFVQDQDHHLHDYACSYADDYEDF